MRIDGFWDLIEASGADGRGADDREEWLTDRLAALPAAEIEDFQIHLDETRERADTWRLWGAAYLVCDGLCSDDGFFYFQAWLVGLGRDTFGRVVADPDTLADVPQIQRLAGRDVNEWDEDEWPDWESLDYVADEAHERVTGLQEGLDDALEARGHEGISSPDPADQRWDFADPAEIAGRLPRLNRMFTLTYRDRLARS